MITKERRFLIIETESAIRLYRILGDPQEKEINVAMTLFREPIYIMEKPLDLAESYAYKVIAKEEPL